MWHQKFQWEERLLGAQLVNGYHTVIWLRYLTCGLSKLGWGLFDCPHTSPLSREQLANYSVCGETHTDAHTHLLHIRGPVTHVLSRISCTHKIIFCRTHLCSLSLSHYKSPHAQFAGWKDQFVYSCGDYGDGGEGETHLRENRGPSPKAL